MAARRGVNVTGAIANGPGRLAAAFALSLDDNGDDVVASNTVRVLRGELMRSVAQSARIGITRDVERCWRFYDPTSTALSRRPASGAAQKSRRASI